MYLDSNKHYIYMDWMKLMIMFTKHSKMENKDVFSKWKITFLYAMHIHNKQYMSYKNFMKSWLKTFSNRKVTVWKLHLIAEPYFSQKEN